MSGLYFTADRTRVKRFSSATTSGANGKTTVQITLETKDEYEAASIIRQLRELEERKADPALERREPVGQAKIRERRAQLLLEDGRGK